VSADKCHHCGSDYLFTEGRSDVWSCGSIGSVQSELCQMTSELTATKLKLASAEARVKELEGLKNHTTGDEPVWLTKFSVYIPDDRIVRGLLATPTTLGGAMPRKES